MKKTNKANLSENYGMNPMGGMMPANGLSYTPDGKGNVTPQPYVTANNLLKAQVPTPAAAMVPLSSGRWPASVEAGWPASTN